MLVPRALTERAVFLDLSLTRPGYELGRERFAFRLPIANRV